MRKLSFLTSLLFIAAVIEVGVGPISIPPVQVFKELIHYFQGTGDTYAIVLGDIRLPRLLVACLVGAGLASTGVVLQAIFQNPMADPGIIGVSSGGSLGAVLMIATGMSGISPWATPFGAFLFGMITIFLIYRLGTIAGRTNIHTVLLSGIAVSSLCTSIVAMLLSLSPMEMTKQILFWLLGGLDGVLWTHVSILVGFIAIGLIVYFSQSHALDILSLGEEQAIGVGVNLQRVKLLLLITSGFVVGACVSVTGVIGFIGLIVPHILRTWIGAAHRRLIVASAIGGALLLIVADIIARMLLNPIELNVGIVTSCLGVPFFLYLLRRHYNGFGRQKE